MNSISHIKKRRELGESRARAEYHSDMFGYHIRRDQGRDFADLWRTMPIVYHLFAYAMNDANVICLTQELSRAGV